MNSYVNEDVMWQRLKDIQLEAENRRLYGPRAGLLELAWLLGKRVWWVAGLAMRRPPRRRSLHVVDGDSDAASHAA
jgi:hypothetical protein